MTAPGKIVDALWEEGRRGDLGAATANAPAIYVQLAKMANGWTVRRTNGGKQVNGRKRHTILETLGHWIAVVMTSANADEAKPA